MSASPSSVYYPDHRLSWWDPSLIASSSSEQLPDSNAPMRADSVPDIDDDDHDDLDADEILEELFPVPSGRTDSLSSSSTCAAPSSPTSAGFPAHTGKPVGGDTPFPAHAPHAPPAVPPHVHTHRRRPSSVSSSASSLASAATRATAPRSILARAGTRSGAHAGGNTVKFAERPTVLSCRYEADEDEDEDEDDVDSAYASGDDGPQLADVPRKPPPPVLQRAGSLSRAPSLRGAASPRASVPTLVPAPAPAPVPVPAPAVPRPAPPPRSSSESTYRTAAQAAVPPAGDAAKREQRAGLLRRLASTLNIKPRSAQAQAQAQAPVPPAPHSAPALGRSGSRRGAPPAPAPAPAPAAPPRRSREARRSAPPSISGPLPLGSVPPRAPPGAPHRPPLPPQYDHRAASRVSLDARSVRSERSVRSLREVAGEPRVERERDRGLRAVLGRLAR